MRSGAGRGSGRKSHADPPLPLKSRLNKGSTIHATIAVREQKVIYYLHFRALPRSSGTAGNRRPEGLLLYFVRNAALNSSTLKDWRGLPHPPSAVPTNFDYPRPARYPLPDTLCLGSSSWNGTSGAAAFCLREFPCLGP